MVDERERYETIREEGQRRPGGTRSRSDDAPPQSLTQDEESKEEGRSDQDRRPDGERSAPPCTAEQGLLGLFALRLLAALGLASSAWVHAHQILAVGLGGAPFTQGQLFDLEAAASVSAAALLLARDQEGTWLGALVVAAGSLVVLLLSVYLPVPATGPFPALEGPWSPEKVVAAAALTSVPVLWVVRQVMPPR